MSLFSGIFDSTSSVERELHELYTQLLTDLFGMPSAEAKEMVSLGIAKCKQDGKSEGTADLPTDFGDRLLEAACNGKPDAKRYVEKIRREGVTDDDIREWWNQPDLRGRLKS